MQLSELFAIPEKRVQEPEQDVDAPIAAGFREEDDDERLNIYLKKRVPTGRRFALARIVGDHLTALQDEQILPVTEAKTERQKFQRAFSQEFLCPFKDLADALSLGTNQPTDDQIDDVAHHFQVSPLCIKTTLVNRGVMGRETLSVYRD